MKLGVVFPTSEIGPDPVVIRDYVQTAEGLGYERLSTYEHVLGAQHADRDPALRGPYTEHTPFHEPLVLFGFMAAVTKSIELCTSVLVLPQRQTALVAKQAAELALLSGGRFVLGAGVGWNHVEYEALGVSYEARGARLEEQVGMLRSLLAGGLVESRGRFHTLDRVAMSPVDPTSVPIWFGGSAPHATDRAARLGDGFVFRSRGEDLAREYEHLVERMADHGRSMTNFGTDRFVDLDDRASWESTVADWERLGGTVISLRTFRSDLDWSRSGPMGTRTVAEHLEALALFAAEFRTT